MNAVFKRNIKSFKLFTVVGVFLTVMIIHIITTDNKFFNQIKLTNIINENSVKSNHINKTSSIKNHEEVNNIRIDGIRINTLDTKDQNFTKPQTVDDGVNGLDKDESETKVVTFIKETHNHSFKKNRIPDNVALNISAKMFPNMPIEFWKNVESKKASMFYMNPMCSPFPDIFKLDIQNVYWQTVLLSDNSMIQLYSAHYDEREIYPGKDVRILSMVNRTVKNFPGNKTLFCQFWFDNELQPVVVPMNRLDYIWYDYWGMHGEGVLGPYLLGCSLPELYQNKVPRVVSVVENPCDAARNMLTVTYIKPDKKKEFCVCVKGLDFFHEDYSVRLVEWIEFVLLMGVHKIFFYRLELHPNMTKVLDHYIKLGKVEVMDITLPNGSVNIPYLQHEFLKKNNHIQCLDEIIPYNDCFYRNLYSYDYVGMFDVDEIIIPLRDTNWHDLIQRTMEYEKPSAKINAFTARHVLFLDRMQIEGRYPHIPSYMHMMQHVFRAENYTAPGEYTKTIFNTNYTITCHNHWPMATAPDTITVDFELEDARVQHYRHDCPEDIVCDTFKKFTVKDVAIWNYLDTLVPAVKETLNKIGFLKD